MKAFRMTGKENILEFTNYNRISEDVLFNDVVERLKKMPELAIGPKKTGPSEDLYNCTIGAEHFTLCFDVDYGPSIYSESTDILKKLIEYFND